MLLEAAIGDAYGAAFEYADITSERPNDLLHYYGHPRHQIGFGKYTDDVEMSTAVAEAMLECYPGPLTKECLAKWFVNAFHREQRPGYAGGFYNFLLKTTTVEEFLKNILPDSDKSGAAMRGWVCGLYDDMFDAMAMAELQARLTHNTFGGRTSAMAAALLTHYFAYNLGPRTSVAAFIQSHVDGPWQEDRNTPVGSKGIDSTHAAIQAVMMHDSMSEILKQSIAFTGDVDTVATIALGSASFSSEIKQDLPQNLIDRLEPSIMGIKANYGVSYLKDLDQKLFSIFLTRH